MPHAWTIGRVVSSGIVFISADYRLIPPATGHDILADIKDLFAFLQHDVNDRIRERFPGESTFEIDANALAVAGSSAGAMCAYLAAIHASPRPKAILSLYGMGGDMLVSLFTTRQCCDSLICSDMAIPRSQDRTLLPRPGDAPTI